ncbi:caffeine-induced death protein 2-domain-containing protein [Lipomyces kononenkoae]|uniref:Caffeine-induced death protein 2-domain-containing protein n=1 Tax=Lipomyces kononenkoae TaxID=34357 RepID=A0ACC3TCU0_LIPKO
MPVEKPALTPELCYSAESLRRFLLFSRSLTDDTISADLNSIPMLKESKTLGSGSSWTKPEREKVGSRRRICKGFIYSSVFESWKGRDEILEYCEKIANDRKSEISAIAAKKPKVDPRLDPYEARDLPTYTKEEEILSWVRVERGVEDIVRDRSWSIICERCIDIGADSVSGDTTAIGDNGSGWKPAYRTWKDSKFH